MPKIEGNENEDNINQNDISKVSKASNNFSEGLHLKKKKLSAFILLLSLSIHGLFECLALGIQTNYNDALLLFIALMIHKWAEAFALGILFVKAKFTKKFGSYCWRIFDTWEKICQIFFVFGWMFFAAGLSLLEEFL